MTNLAPNTHFRQFKSLYWKLSGVFLVLLAVLALSYLFVTIYTAEMYYQEATQRLNAKLGGYLADHTKPFTAGQVNREALRGLFDEVMVINPSVEVYLIDTTGKILAYSAPDSLIVRSTVRMSPIREFAANGPRSLLLGDDPRSTLSQKAFSAAPITDHGRLEGYYYVILGSQKYESAVQMLEGSYFVRLGLWTIVLTVIAAAVIGLLAFAYITRHLRRTIHTVRKFQEGDLTVRIPPNATPEINELGMAFNEMADALVRHIEEIRTLDTLRRDLVANVSHDLRTPLVSIHGYVETVLMKDGSLTDEQRRAHLQAVLHNTGRLKTLVEELLELSRLEARQITPQQELFSVGDLVQDVVQKHRIQAVDNGVPITMDLPRGLPLVVGDIGLIERVLQNLLDNAIKYTSPPGTITIALTSSGTGVKVDVADTGPGIPPEDLPHIFDRFRRGRNGTRNGSSGTGLGLAIVRKILDLHDISIAVASNQGLGTTFSFVLPHEGVVAEHALEQHSRVLDSL